MADSKPSTANPLWGGRFAAGPARIMAAINASVDFDRRLAEEDLRASRAHVRMLARQGIVSADDERAVLAGLETIEQEIRTGAFTFSRALEDVHMNVESRLRELVGAPAGRLHTARSRNDQVVLDLRLYLLRAGRERSAGAPGRRS